MRGWAGVRLQRRGMICAILTSIVVKASEQSWVEAAAVACCHTGRVSHLASEGRDGGTARAFERVDCVDVATAAGWRGRKVV